LYPDEEKASPDASSSPTDSRLGMRRGSPGQSFRVADHGLTVSTVGYTKSMELSILLIIIGIVLAILVNYILGIIVILIGLAMLLLPRMRGGTRQV
jgi:hypothetical protein